MVHTVGAAVVAIATWFAMNIGSAHADPAKAIKAFKAGDYVEAERQARAAIAAGEGRGYEILAGLMMARTDRDPDVDGAIAMLQEGRRAGWLRANVLLATLLRSLGRSSGKFAEDESFGLLQEAAERGFPPAQYFVAKEFELLFMAYERTEHRSSALKWFREAAKSATSVDMEEARVTGEQIYCEVAGRIEEALQSPQDAFAWYRRCAEVGCRAGMEKLAGIYEVGSHGEKQDLAAARQCKESARTAKPNGCSLD